MQVADVQFLHLRNAALAKSVDEFQVSLVILRMVDVQVDDLERNRLVRLLFDQRDAVLLEPARGRADVCFPDGPVLQALEIARLPDGRPQPHLDGVFAALALLENLLAHAAEIEGALRGFGLPPRGANGALDAGRELGWNEFLADLDAAVRRRLHPRRQRPVFAIHGVIGLVPGVERVFLGKERGRLLIEVTVGRAIQVQRGQRREQQGGEDCE